MPKALRAEINDVVVKYTERKLRKDGTLDVAVMAHEMTQSLVDMIMDQDEHDHAPLLALSDGLCHLTAPMSTQNSTSTPV